MRFWKRQFLEDGVLKRFFPIQNWLSCQWALHFLLKFNNIIEQIMILDLICGFHRRIDSVVFILAAFDFSNEGYGFQKFDYFRQNHRLQ